MQWHEIELIVESLEEQYPDVVVDELSLSDLYDLILDLPEFSDDPESVNDSSLKKILEHWYDLRSEEE
jgi:FeS assembly protein IscX